MLYHKKTGMSMETLLVELKKMRSQIRVLKATVLENNRLDAEYWHIRKMDQKGCLDIIPLPEPDAG